MIIYYEYANYYDDDVEEDDNQLPLYHPLQGRALERRALWWYFASPDCKQNWKNYDKDILHHQRYFLAWADDQRYLFIGADVRQNDDWAICNIKIFFRMINEHMMKDITSLRWADVKNISSDLNRSWDIVSDEPLQNGSHANGVNGHALDPSVW